MVRKNKYFVALFKFILFSTAHFFFLYFSLEICFIILRFISGFFFKFSKLKLQKVPANNFFFKYFYLIPWQSYNNNSLFYLVFLLFCGNAHLN